MIYFSSHKFVFSNLRFSSFYEHFRQLREKFAFKLKNKVHHVNQLIEPDLMMYIRLFLKKPLHSTHSTHSTYLFKIFFSLLTLSTAFLHKANGPGKNIVTLTLFFPGPQAFCKKAVERVRSKKNILNSSVEWSGWSGFFLEKAICMYIIRSGSMSWLTWCTLFLIWMHISRVIDENVRKIAKNGDLKTRIYGSKNISSCRA